MSKPTYDDLIAFAAMQPCVVRVYENGVETPPCGTCIPCLARAYKARPSPADAFQGFSLGGDNLKRLHSNFEMDPKYTPPRAEPPTRWDDQDQT